MPDIEPSADFNQDTVPGSVDPNPPHEESISELSDPLNVPLPAEQIPRNNPPLVKPAISSTSVYLGGQTPRPAFNKIVAICVAGLIVLGASGFGVFKFVLPLLANEQTLWCLQANDSRLREGVSSTMELEIKYSGNNLKSMLYKMAFNFPDESVAQQYNDIPLEDIFEGLDESFNTDLSSNISGKTVNISANLTLKNPQARTIKMNGQDMSIETIEQLKTEAEGNDGFFGGTCQIK